MRRRALLPTSSGAAVGSAACRSRVSHFFDDSAKLADEYSFGDLYLYDYAAEGDGFVTLALSRYRSGSAAQLVTVNSGGNVLGECTPTGSVTSLSVNGKQVLVQYSDRLTLYNQQLDEIKSVEQNLLGVRRSVLLRRGRGAARERLERRGARLLTPAA